jgi:hypothetical protein
VVALPPVVTKVVVLAIGVVAAESTTIATTRSTKRCPAVAEATVPGHAVLMTSTEVLTIVPTMNNGKTYD